MKRPIAIAVSLALASGCGGGSAGESGASGTVPLTSFASDTGFYDAPFPSDHRRDAAGRPSLAGFPNPDGVGLVDDVLALTTADADGFAVTAGAFFRFSAPLDPASLPAAPLDTLESSAAVFLIDVDPASPERGRRYPLHAGYQDDAGPLGAPNLLVLLPLQGIPLREGTRYAAGLTRAVRDAAGAPLAASAETRALVRGQRPAGLDDAVFAEYRDALATLAELGRDPRELAALTVFTTGRPMRRMEALAARMETIALPEPVSGWELTDAFDDFCVLAARIDIPVFQRGEPPFLTSGGDIAFDDQGVPVQQGTEPSRLVVTLPRRAEPAAGFPAMVFVRTGGGGDRPLVDRGREPSHGATPFEPGEGPARYMARAGFAAISWDGPHGGLRNVSGIDEQLTMYNFLNPAALRDNVRETATEAVLVGRMLASLSWPASICPGLDASARADGRAAIDEGRMGIMGHSMGGTVAPLALATSPRLRAAVLSGEGGSYLENVLWKESPVAVKPIATAILRYGQHGAELTRADPFLSILQWASESADPPAYGRALIHTPVAGASRHVLMFQGIVDTYITPTIANASTGSFGLDLAGPALDASVNEMLVASGAERTGLPARGNLRGSAGEPITGVVVQHREDGVEDGHEVMFQLDEPKRQYQCFLSGFGVDRVPLVTDGAAESPCTP